MAGNFRNLLQEESDVFEQIAINNDMGHPPAVLKRLEVKQLIVKKVESNGMKHYYVPIPIHIEWCQWCSEQPEIAGYEL